MSLRGLTILFWVDNYKNHCFSKSSNLAFTSEYFPVITGWDLCTSHPFARAPYMSMKRIAALIEIFRLKIPSWRYDENCLVLTPPSFEDSSSCVSIILSLNPEFWDPSSWTYFNDPVWRNPERYTSSWSIIFMSKFDSARMQWHILQSLWRK